MKRSYAFLPVLGLILAHTVSAQEAVTSGEIRYEVTRQIDPSQMRININGQEYRPGSTLPNGQTFDVPQARSFEQTLVFSNGMAAEKSDMGNFAMMRMGNREGRPDGPPGGGAPGEGRRGQFTPGGNMRNFRPFENETYIDLEQQNRISVLGIKKDSVTTDYYRNDEPIVRDSTWREDGSKTKKLLGYKCQKAVAIIRNKPYTIWYTTELPFTYSPMARLTPDKGVVLQIESEMELYKATKVDAKPVDGATLKPNPKAQLVSKKQMEEVRRKAMASFRQRVMADNPMRN
jgi:hypothetical protein